MPRSGHALRMLAGLALGATLGIAAHLTLGDSAALAQFVALVTQPIGAVFLRLLFMLVIPLIVSALALGVAGVGDVRALGRIGIRTLCYTVAVSTLSVAIGVGLVNWLRPGDGISPALRAQLTERARTAPLAAPPKADMGVDFFVNLVPANPIRAMADG